MPPSGERCSWLMRLVGSPGRIAALSVSWLLAVGGDESRASSASGSAGLPGGVCSSVLFGPAAPQPAAAVDQGGATGSGDVRIDAAGESANVGKHPIPPALPPAPHPVKSRLVIAIQPTRQAVAQGVRASSCH
jgi:hypothetical protein